MGGGHLRLAVVLGLMALAGPFAIDMYLPAMPTIAKELGVSESRVQMTLMAFMVPFGAAQIVYGPWSDQVGRKTPIYFGLALFALASVGAALSETLETLLFWRAVQGAGGAASMVVSRAVIRDLETGPAATRLMATIMLVIAVSPMLAPLAGSGVIAVASWRAVFWVLTGIALAGGILIFLMLDETLKPDKRVPINLPNMRKGSARLLRDPYFLGLTFIGALGMSSFFVFIASAPFVYTGIYGLTPTGFAIAFAINAIGFFSASQLAGPLGERFGMARVVGIGLSIFLVFSLCILGFVWVGVAPLWLLVGGLLLANSGLGLVIPSCMVMSLDNHGDIAGLASSLGGTLQMVIAGLSIAIAGPFFDGSVFPMVAAIATCAVMAMGLSLLTLGRDTHPQ